MAIDSSSSSSAPAPGFRFHPTDEELVRYYLRRKVCGKPFRFDAISEIDIYNAEPWDLPGRSRLKTRDLEWYFFSVLDKKYGNGSRTNRATGRGYWKTTGKDRPVYHKLQIVGMKKTLVFHSGRAPRGERTNWVMHEYRLVDEALEKAGIVQDAFVLCRVFQKSGSGPKNGEQYGAPFVEEEWEDDELAMVPKEEVAEEVSVEVIVSDDAYLDGTDLKLVLGEGVPMEDAPLPSNFCEGDNVNHVQESTDFIDDVQRFWCQILGEGVPMEDAPLPSNFYEGDNINHVQESTDFIDDDQRFSVDMIENQIGQEQQPDCQNLLDLPVRYNMEAHLVEHDYIGESSNTANPADVDGLFDESFLDAMDKPPFDDGAFLETNDLTNSIEADPGFDMFEEYLTFFDAEGDDSQYISFHPPAMESENLVSDQVSLNEKQLSGGSEQPTMANQQHLEGHSNDVASSSKQEPDKFVSGMQYPFMKQASHMLGSIPAPPAFASEFPANAAALHLNSASQSSSSVHFTAGMIQIRDATLSGNQTDWWLGKHGNFNIVLSFGLPQGGDNSVRLEPLVSTLSGKAGSAVSRGWFYFIFLWVLILSMTFKFGAYVCAT